MDDDALGFVDKPDGADDAANANGNVEVDAEDYEEDEKAEDKASESEDEDFEFVSNIICFRELLATP